MDGQTARRPAKKHGIMRLRNLAKASAALKDKSEFGWISSTIFDPMVINLILLHHGHQNKRHVFEKILMLLLKWARIK